MKKINVTISDTEFDGLGIKTGEIDFSFFIDMIHKKLIRQNLNECVKLAAQYELSSMSMDEITDEVRAVRKHAQCCT